MHGDGVRVHGKVQEEERDNGARACTGRCREPGQRAITVHGRCTGAGGKVQGTGAERDNGARVKGSGAASDNGARGRCRDVRGGAGRGRGRAR